MKLISYDGITLASLNVKAGVDQGAQIGLDGQANTLARHNTSPLPNGVERDGLTIPAQFLVARNNATEQTIVAFLNALKPLDTTERTLVAQFDMDGDGTPETSMQIQASILGFNEQRNVNQVNVTFYATKPVWLSATTKYAQGPANNQPFLVAASPANLAFTNNGKVSSSPLIALTMASGGQRVTQSRYVGWKWRKIQPITNNTVRDWYNELGVIDLGDTATLVSGTKALSGGADLRVRLEGKEIQRTLLNWNTLRTFVAIPLNIPAGQTVNYEIVYGNSSASSSDALTMSGYTRFDTSYSAADLTSDNGTATAGAATTLTDGSKAWPVAYWAGGFVQIVAGTGVGQRRQLTTNAATSVTVGRAWTTNPDATSKYILWKTGIAVDGGAASGAGTTTTLTDASQAWPVNFWKNGFVWNVTKGIGPFLISSNTATVLTTAAMTAPALNDVYYIEKYGYHSYNVRQVDNDYNHRGLWQNNRLYSIPSKTAFGDRCVAGWRRATYLKNEDDYAQQVYRNYGAIGTHAKWFIATLYAERRRSSDRNLAEEGQGDGVTITDARSFTGIQFNYQLLNQNSVAGAAAGIGKFVMATRESGANAWSNQLEDTALLATATARAFAFTDISDSLGNPLHIYMGVIPADEVGISKDASVNDTIRADLNTRLETMIDPTSITFGTLGTEQAIYDLNGTISTLYSGFWGAMGNTLVFGGAGHYIHLGPGEVIWVDCEQGLIYLTSGGPISLSAGYLFQKYVPWAAVVGKTRVNNFDATLPLITDTYTSWMPVDPGAQTWHYTEDSIGSVEILIAYAEGFLG